MTINSCHIVHPAYQLQRYSTTLFNRFFLLFLLDSIIPFGIEINKVPKRLVFSSFYSLNWFENLRFSTTLCCGIPLPFAGFHYPILPNIRGVLQSILRFLSSITPLNCGIPLPQYIYKSLFYSGLTSFKEIRSYIFERYSTTFCGISLPYAVYHYLILRYSTTLFAVYHYLFLRYYTTSINFKNKLLRSIYNSFLLFFEGVIKLFYKTLFNYIIKGLRTSLPFSSQIKFAYANAPMHLKEKENDL